MQDLGKIAVIAGIMGALLLFGLFMASNEPVVVEQVVAPVVIAEPVAGVTILPQQSLEMLDPVYSEKAVFHDDTIRIAFDAAFNEDGVESKIPFWIHNVSDDVINILWDRCSIQLPCGNTVNTMNEAGPEFFAPIGRTISIAPAGDLFDAFVPVTEIVWTDDTSSLTTNVLTEGIFTLVLAIERSIGASCGMMQQEMPKRAEAGCEPACEMAVVRPAGHEMNMAMSEGREVVYYTFRFVLR
ncbi:hypothetical protein KKG90_05520 [Candidatus Bipolaricaulota bacterium]|nr:hypothetical protein [Candidatus Bipolaricaulota bacterium]